MKKVALHNLGCKVNAYETEAMQQMLEAADYEIVPFKEQADIYIVNTCTVTNMADRKSRQMLNRAKKMNPEAIVVAAGCYVQAKDEKEVLEKSIDVIIGNNMKKDLISILQAYEKDKKGNENLDSPNVDSDGIRDHASNNRLDINRTNEYESLMLNNTIENTRAYIKVQDGCNQFCTYCIIPHVRGRVRSRKKEEVRKEVSRLVAVGYKEVVLTGIHLGSYGIDLSESLLSLIELIHEVEGLKRIRLGSLEPRVMSEHFIKTIAELEKVCPHFHLSLQSGCDETLQRMNRRYTTDEYYKTCENIRKYYSHPAITTDIIVGFPGETEAEFEQTKAFVDRINFYETHIFKYSPREGTKAATMRGQVDESIKACRSNELMALSKQKQQQFEKSLRGKEVEVLLEEKKVIDGVEYWVGHTKEYVKIGIQDKKNLKNQLVNKTLGKSSQIVY